MTNMLRPILRDNPPRNQQTATQTIDNALASTVFALRAAVHPTPAVLAFHRDMILHTPFIADLRGIQERRHQIIDLSAARDNKHRIDHDYRVNEQVLGIGCCPRSKQVRTKIHQTL